MNNKLILIALSSLPLILSNAHAATYSRNGFSIDTSVGAVSGESHEYVFEDDGRKLSQLDWKIKHAPIIKGEINWDVAPWLSMNARGWTTFTSSDSQMDDYDWPNPNQSHWTDWSHHENTRLNYANDIDLNLRGWILQNQNYKLGVTAGYERNVFSFKANGGCYQYNSGRMVGCFTDIPVIKYQQTFNTPYVGLAGKYLINRFELGAAIKFSNWVKGNDVDEHYLRNLTFTGNGRTSRYQSATLEAGYLTTQNTKIFAAATYNHYSRNNASTAITDNASGERAFFPNSAGLDNKNYTFAIGVNYIF